MKRKVSTLQKSSVQIVGIDLFCGVGGLTHGLVRGGVQVAAGVDIDSSCRFPFEKNNAAIFIEQDVAELEPSHLLAQWEGAETTLLAGCAPCQPFSTYSRSNRERDKKAEWSLVAAFGRLVNRLQPKLVTIENVPQLASHPVFAELLVYLKSYHVWWSIVECSTIGVPQTRKRLVLLASRLGDKKLELWKPSTTRPTVRQAIGSLTPLRAGEKDPKDDLHMACSLSSLNLARIKASRPGGSWRDWPSELRAACHRKETGATYPSVYGRMEWDQPAPTVTTQCFGYGNGRFGHPEQDRAISLREAAMLQTFPRSYKFAPPGSLIRFNRMGRLIGNAVPVRLGEVIGRSLVMHVKACADMAAGSSESSSRDNRMNS